MYSESTTLCKHDHSIIVTKIYAPEPQNIINIYSTCIHMQLSFYKKNLQPFDKHQCSLETKCPRLFFWSKINNNVAYNLKAHNIMN